MLNLEASSPLPPGHLADRPGPHAGTALEGEIEPKQRWYLASSTGLFAAGRFLDNEHSARSKRPSDPQCNRGVLLSIEMMR